MRGKLGPIATHEGMYRLPYHWFPETPLKEFERKVKQRIVFSLIDNYLQQPIRYFLDVGCGDGRWTSDIYKYLERMPETAGIDFSERAIACAKLITPGINYLNHRGEELPFADCHFDLVTAIEVIEHVEDRAEERFLQECLRVLKPNGLFILTTPSWNLRLAKHHFRHYSIERLSELLTKHGFELVSMRGQSLPCYGLKRKIRKTMGHTPKLWQLWKFTYREVSPEKALNLILAARPTRRA